MRAKRAWTLLAAFVAAGSAPALADETRTYSYDAQGRLITSSSTGTINNGVATGTSFDCADNRTNQTVTGATTGSSSGSAPGPVTCTTTGGGAGTDATFTFNPIGSYSLTSGHVDYGAYWVDGYSQGALGALTNASLSGGFTIGQIEALDINGTNETVYLGISGISIPPPNSGWSSITIPGLGTFSRAAATYGTAGTLASWSWPASGTLTSGTVVIQ